jgi:hypothetical protein
VLEELALLLVVEMALLAALAFLALIVAIFI